MHMRFPTKSTHLWRYRMLSTHKLEFADRAQGASSCVFAILAQQKTFLSTISDEIYTFPCTLLKGTIGQHTRHSLDHLRKPIEIVKKCQEDQVIRYDIRERNTSIETKRQEAIELIDQLIDNLQHITKEEIEMPVQAAFMLASDGKEFAFQSSVAREMGFAVHHCVHHNALVKVIMCHNFPEIQVLDDFGMAPSTSNFLLHSSHPSP